MTARVAIVMSSAISKYGRMDAEFFLGNPKEDIASIKRARKGVKDAQKRLKTARAEAHVNRDRVRAMRASGEVR